MEYESLLENVQALLRLNRVQSGRHRYTRPAPSTYEQQWLWDSCFHAIIYGHFDADMGRAELRSLLDHRGVDLGGMVPHMVYWQGGGEALWGRSFTSTITQPPLVATAALALHHADPDLDFLRSIYPRMLGFYDWLAVHRSLGDGLVRIIHPWESGWDASPRWDALLGLDHPTPDQTKQARFDLATELRVNGTELAPIAGAGRFNVAPADFNAIYAANLDALAVIAHFLGHCVDAQRLNDRAEAVRRVMNDKMWDSAAATYVDLAGAADEPVTIATAAPFVTLFGGVPNADQAKALCDHLEGRFGAPFSVPTVARDAPTYAPGDYWRGSTWLNVNWLIVTGLRAYGFDDLAKRVVDDGLRLVGKSGFREYFDAETGAGGGSRDHSWSGIVIDLMRPLRSVQADGPRSPSPP